MGRPAAWLATLSDDGPSGGFSRDRAAAWAVVLDAEGRIARGRGDVGGDPLLLGALIPAPS